MSTTHLSTNYHTVTACFTAKPGKEKELLAVLTNLVTETLKEEGCVNYDLHQDQNNPGRFMFYENWVSKEAHAKHCQTPHLANWREVRGELVETTAVSSWMPVV